MVTFVLFTLYLISYVDSQNAEERRFFSDPELATIPKEIINCYMDMSLWDRYRRLPNNVESLVALLRHVAHAQL